MRMQRRIFIYFLAIVIAFSSYIAAVSDAEARRRCGGMKNDTSHCGLWLCIPGGMGVGCAAMSAALGKRLSRGCPSLPSYSVCSGGGNGGQRSGIEEYRQCDPGFSRRYIDVDVTTNTTKRVATHCINSKLRGQACTGAGYNLISFNEDDSSVCAYRISKRQFPHWIEVVVEGQTFKRYWHDGRGNGPEQGTTENELNELENLGMNPKEARDTLKSGVTAESIEEQETQNQIQLNNNQMNTNTPDRNNQLRTQQRRNSGSAAPPVRNDARPSPGSSLRREDLPTRQIIDNY